MIDPKRHFGSVLFGCLVLFFLLSHGGPTQTHPATAQNSAVSRDPGYYPPAVPSLLPARSQGASYNRLACRQACEQVGIWDTEREVAQRLINTCMIGCDLGQKHCS